MGRSAFIAAVSCSLFSDSILLPAVSCVPSNRMVRSCDAMSAGYLLCSMVQFSCSSLICAEVIGGGIIGITVGGDIIITFPNPPGSLGFPHL